MSLFRRALAIVGLANAAGSERVNPATLESVQAVTAKLPAVGTAGMASANVLTVQGIASGTTLPVTEASAAAILAALPTDTLAMTTITVTVASATIQALLTTAGGALSASVKRLTLIPTTDISMGVGGAAVLGTNVLAGGVRYDDILCKVATDIRLIAGGNVTCIVIQEG